MNGYSALQYRKDNPPEKTFFYNEPLNFYRDLKELFSNLHQKNGELANFFKTKLFMKNLPDQFPFDSDIDISITTTDHQEFNYELTEKLEI
jgi:hypothetical protein